ncbi:MAG: hypothetical protein FWG50_04915 [Kiritimatiellaeota bacterium]|nr:hypothetical protein [Kiritimatiellota bacterium]
MAGLYRAYYTGAKEEAFGKDLAEKDWVVLLKAEGRVCGFSTQRLITGIECRQNVCAPGTMNVLFSGDTIVDSGVRGQSGLAGGFGHLMAYLNERYDAQSLFWFLISKGARTYRFLPTFFKRYVPGPVADVDLDARLRDVATRLYPKEYQPETGVLHFEGDKDRLIADELREDTASRFFRKRNPRWTDGDELCCFAPLPMDNLNRLGERVIRSTVPRWDISP